MNRVSTKALLAAALTATLVGCGGAATSGTSSSDSFVSVPKTGDSATQGDAQSFYLVLNRKELGNKWFLSAYLKQYFPGAVAYGAARSLGTKVVSFEQHNDKLFVIDSSGTKQDSQTFDPKLIIDAFPVVTDAAILKQYPTSTWVVFDPAAGLDRFGVYGNDAGAQGYQFTTELKFAQNFKKVTDGVVWEQVFEGYANLPDPNSWQLGEDNQFKGSGTLGIALRRYSEGQGFKPAPTNPPDNFFFYDQNIQLVPDSGQITAPFVKWNIYPGMKPIQWVISNNVKLTEAAYGGKYDLQGALKNAVEHWNQVFGFTVVQAHTGDGTESFADDTVNMIVWDTDPTLGYAFANWRSNPVTGEIRGASVYMNSSWVDDADQYWPDDQSKPVGAALKREKAKQVPMLAWESMGHQSLCQMWQPRFRGDADFAAGTTGLADPATLTKKQKVEQFLTHVVLHEIGHTLGLRHNFMGSFVAPGAALPSTSVMDYLLNDDSYPMNNPGTYDADALKYLYGMSASAPAQLFCTDDGVGQNPDCQTFDRGNDPLNAFYGRYYTAYLNGFYKTQNVFYLLYWDYWLNKVGNYVRGGATPAVQAAATNLMLATVTAPASSAQLSQPGMGAMIDLVAQYIFQRLYLDPANLRGEIGNDPGSTVNAIVLPQLKANLQNVDGIRSFATRRLTVDIMKKLQTTDAYTALVTARASIAAARASISDSTQAALTDDLLARIDSATHPYFQ